MYEKKLLICKHNVRNLWLGMSNLGCSLHRQTAINSICGIYWGKTEAVVSICDSLWIYQTTLIKNSHFKSQNAGAPYLQQPRSVILFVTLVFWCISTSHQTGALGQAAEVTQVNVNPLSPRCPLGAQQACAMFPAILVMRWIYLRRKFSHHSIFASLPVTFTQASISHFHVVYLSHPSCVKASTPYFVPWYFVLSLSCFCLCLETQTFPNTLNSMTSQRLFIPNSPKLNDLTRQKETEP